MPHAKSIHWVLKETRISNKQSALSEEQSSSQKEGVLIFKVTGKSSGLWNIIQKPWICLSMVQCEVSWMENIKTY